MRIIAGEWKRRQLLVPKGDTTRPSADRTRETLFSMLISRIGTFEGLAVADLFAGSGALGLEALSRGAASCVFVEQDAAAVRAIRANIGNLCAQQQCDVRASSALVLGPVRKPLDLILLDPPYLTGAGVVALDKMDRLGWIGPATWIALEVFVKEEVKLKTLVIESERKVGTAKLVLIRQAPQTPQALAPGADVP